MRGRPEHNGEEHVSEIGRREFLKRSSLAGVAVAAGEPRAAEHARRMYAAFGVPERLGYDIHDGAHEFNGVEAFAFMRRWV